MAIEGSPGAAVEGADPRWLLQIKMAQTSDSAVLFLG